MTENEKLRQRFAAALMPNYGLPSLALSHGQGTRVYDVDGGEYLDFFAGIAVSSLGHNHPALVEAVSTQVAKIAHTSNLLLHEPEVALAERLLELSGASGKVLFTNSGTEANEAALKLALLHGRRQGRGYIVAAQDGFHGRTLGALAVTGKAEIREPFGPFGIDVRFVPYGDLEALREAVDGECAAVILEPAQGETGVVPSPRGYFAGVRRICDTAGALFIADEIQSGIGRTGNWFAYQESGITPDVLTLAKGLGGGLPIGACVGFGECADVFSKGTHGTTFGGNPVATAAAGAVLRTIASDRLLDNAVRRGTQLADGITGLNHPLVSRVRGVGLWHGIVLHSEVSSRVAEAAQVEGALVNAVRPDVIRLAPPLTVSAEEIERFLAIFARALDAAAASGGQP